MKVWLAAVTLCLVGLVLSTETVKRRYEGRNVAFFVDLQTLQNFNRTRLRERESRLDERLRRRWDNRPVSERAAIKAKAERWAQRRWEKVNPAGDTLDEINAKGGNLKVEGGNLFEGDMVLTDEQLDVVLADDDDDDGDEEKRAKRQAYKTALYPSNTWIGMKIYWTASPEILAHNNTLQAINKAIRFWELRTCIRFVSGSSYPQIRFMNGGGYYSNVGRVQGSQSQDISLGPGCDTVGIATHEIAHALGFLHAQSRHDRENYITINFANIQVSENSLTKHLQAGFEHNFRKETTATNDNYGQPYDLGSIMQYKAGDFAKNPSIPVIMANEAGYQNTMGHVLPTFYDVYMMNQFYKCFDPCPKPGPACLNGGVPDVNNCHKYCHCPLGYGGGFCQELNTDTCLVDGLLASSTVKTYATKVIGDGQMVQKLDYAHCFLHLKAPAGKRIRIKIVSVGNVCAPGCTYGGIEVYLKADKRQSGYRYCCNQDAGTIITTETNTTRIRVYNRYYSSQTTIEYSAV